MKKILYLSMLLLPLVGCKATKTAEKLAHERDSLNTLLVEKDSMINDVFASIGAVSDNLTAIKTREKLINQQTESGELDKHSVARINEDIEAINQLLIENKQTISRLQQSANALKQANVKIAGMERMIAQLNREIEEKDQQITLLRKNLQSAQEQVSTLTTQVSGLNTEVGQLSREKETLTGEVKSTTTALNTAYYIVGSEKELLSKEIVYKRGFIGRTLKINESRSLESFTQIDLRQLDEVMVGQKKAALVSSHPVGSYSWVMDSNGVFASLKITDKAKFWEYSKVLVITYK